MFFRALYKNKVKPGLLYALLACAVDYETDLRHDSKQACKRVMLYRARGALTLHEPSMDTIHALVLMMPVEFMLDRTLDAQGPGYMQLIVATHMCLALGVQQMDREITIKNSIERESMRRVFWACYIMDRINGGHGVPHVIHDDDCHIQFPSHDRHWFSETNLQGGGPMFDPVKLLRQGWTFEDGEQTLCSIMVHIQCLNGKLSDFIYRQAKLTPVQQRFTFHTILQGLLLWWDTLHLTFTCTDFNEYCSLAKSPLPLQSVKNAFALIQQMQASYYAAVIRLYLHGQTLGIHDDPTERMAIDYADKIYQLTTLSDPVDYLPGSVATLVMAAKMFKRQQRSPSADHARLQHQLQELIRFTQANTQRWALSHHFTLILQQL